MPPQAAAQQQDDWGDAPAHAAPDARFEWGDEHEEAQAQPAAAAKSTAAAQSSGWDAIKQQHHFGDAKGFGRDAARSLDSVLPFLMMGGGGMKEVPASTPGPRVPLWRRAGIEPGAPPSSVDATPSEPYRPVRPPRVTAGPGQPPVEAPFRRPSLPAPYATEDAAWRRYPAVDSAQDLAETRDIQSSVKEQAEGEQRNMLRRGTEEGYARNTRPRTSKGELTKQFQSGKPGAKASGSDYPGVDLNSEKELTDLLKRSLELATKVKPRK